MVEGVTIFYDRDIREAVENAVELQMNCGCDEPPKVEANKDGYRKAKTHQRKHEPNGASISFIYPDE